jgi:hypothetical protein
MGPSWEREKELLRGGPKRVDWCGSLFAAERPRDVFNPSVLNVRLVPGRRILSNAIPADGLSAPTSDRSEDAQCNAPPFWAVRERQSLPRRLS